MKNFNRLFGGLLVAFGLLAVMSLSSQASVVARMPKKVYNLNYTNVISSVTTWTGVVVSTTYSQPGAVYELNLSTGTSGDYLILFDTVPVNAGALVAGGTVANGYQIGPRFFFSSTSANTKITFDPPLIFENGLMVLMSTTADQAGITYELGRGLSGQ